MSPARLVVEETRCIEAIVEVDGDGGGKALFQKLESRPPRRFIAIRFHLHGELLSFRKTFVSLPVFEEQSGNSAKFGCVMRHQRHTDRQCYGGNHHVVRPIIWPVVVRYARNLPYSSAAASSKGTVGNEF